MTIRVSYRAWTPERAADIANAHLESYQGLQVQAKMAAADAAIAQIEQQLSYFTGLFQSMYLPRQSQF